MIQALYDYSIGSAVEIWILEYDGKRKYDARLLLLSAQHFDWQVHPSPLPYSTPFCVRVVSLNYRQVCLSDYHMPHIWKAKDNIIITVLY